MCNDNTSQQKNRRHPYIHGWSALVVNCSDDGTFIREEVITGMRLLSDPPQRPTDPYELVPMYPSEGRRGDVLDVLRAPTGELVALHGTYSGLETLQDLVAWYVLPISRNNLHDNGSRLRGLKLLDLSEEAALLEFAEALS